MMVYKYERTARYTALIAAAFLAAFTLTIPFILTLLVGLGIGYTIDNFSKLLVAWQYRKVVHVPCIKSDKVTYLFGTQAAFYRYVYAFLTESEKIACAAIKNKDGIIVVVERPYRHGNAIFGMALLGLEIDHEDEIQGFLTNKGRFVDRFEAKSIAVTQDQLLEKEYDFQQLLSEDVWNDDDHSARSISYRPSNTG
jgi:hypothetical protein